MKLAKKKIKTPKTTDEYGATMISVNYSDLELDGWTIMVSNHMVQGIDPSGNSREGTLLFIDSVSPREILKKPKILEDYE